MVSRHRYSQQPMTPTKSEEQLLPSYDDGSSKNKPHRLLRQGATVTLSQAVLFAAVSASLAAVLTAFGASHYLMGGFDHSVVTLSSHTMQSTYSRRIAAESEVAPSTAEKSKFLSSFGAMSDSMVDETTSLFEGRIQEPEFLRADADEEVDNGQLKVVWLMSFPNSGTSFTLHLTREASNTTTATNYGLEGEIKDEPSIPVFNSSVNGPYWELIPGRVTSLPPKYLLTKTHCGGFCSDCNPKNYIESSRSFQIMCQSGKRGIITDSGPTTELVTYDSSIPKKAIHILRHPLDNVVARFHLIQKREAERKNKAFTHKFPYNGTGFINWCDEQDKGYDLSQPQYRWIDEALWDKLAAVPCRQEFFRYIQWHNEAFTTSRALGLPTLIMYYDDYKNDFDLALKRLLTFLELPSAGGVEPFSSGKIYRDYYSPEQSAAILDLVKEQASAETWHYMKEFEF